MGIRIWTSKKSIFTRKEPLRGQRPSDLSWGTGGTPIDSLVLVTEHQLAPRDPENALSLIVVAADILYLDTRRGWRAPPHRHNQFKSG